MKSEACCREKQLSHENTFARDKIVKEMFISSHWRVPHRRVSPNRQFLALEIDQLF